MSMPRIRIEIGDHPDDPLKTEVKYDLDGFVGSACTDFTNDLEQRLHKDHGLALANKKVEFKPAYAQRVRQNAPERQQEGGRL